jgi:hypothetical protein
MLAATAPYVDAWNAWYADTGNSPAGVAPLRDKVDAAAREAGRATGAIERTVAVQVRMPGGTGRTMGDSDAKQEVAPLQGSAGGDGRGAPRLRPRGIGHVQLVLDPITREAIEGSAPVLAELDRD